MKKNKKELKREQKNLRRLNEMKRKNVSSSEKVKTTKSEFKDMLILFVEGSNDYELNKFLLPTGILLKDLIWLSDTSEPIGKTFYNTKNKIRDKNTGGYIRLTQREIQDLRDRLNPLKNAA